MVSLKQNEIIAENEWERGKEIPLLRECSSCYEIKPTRNDWSMRCQSCFDKEESEFLPEPDADGKPF